MQQRNHNSLGDARDVFRDAAQGQLSGSSELGVGDPKPLSPWGPRKAPALSVAKLVMY